MISRHTVTVTHPLILHQYASRWLAKAFRKAAAFWSLDSDLQEKPLPSAKVGFSSSLEIHEAFTFNRLTQTHKFKRHHCTHVTWVIVECSMYWNDTTLSKDSQALSCRTHFLSSSFINCVTSEKTQTSSSGKTCFIRNFCLVLSHSHTIWCSASYMAACRKDTLIHFTYCTSSMSYEYIWVICFKTQWYRPGTQISNPGTCCCKALQTALLANSNPPDPVQVESNINSDGSFFNLSRVPGTSSAFWTITSSEDKFEYSRKYHGASDASQHEKCTNDSNESLQTPTNTKAMIETKMMAKLRLQLIPRYREAQDCTWDAIYLKHPLMRNRQEITSQAQCHFLHINPSPHFVQSTRYT